MALVDDTTKKADVTDIMNASLKTIDSYPDTWIHMYKDGSAFKGTTKAGYGSLIHFPDGNSSELSGAKS